MGDFTRRVMPEFLIGFFKISEISEISGPYFPLLDEAKRGDGEGAEEDAEIQGAWASRPRGSRKRKKSEPPRRKGRQGVAEKRDDG